MKRMYKVGDKVLVNPIYRDNWVHFWGNPDGILTIKAIKYDTTFSGGMGVKFKEFEPTTSYISVEWIVPSKEHNFKKLIDAYRSIRKEV